MNKDRYVLEALQKAVIAAVAASTDTTLAVKMVGRTITPPTSGKWLEVIQIPINSDPSLGQERLYRGMLRLILHWPVDDKGAYGPMDLLTSITSYFTKGSKHTDSGNNVKVTITHNPAFMGVEEDSPEVRYPASIRYWCYTS